MTKLDFISICNSASVDPSIAIENDEVRAVLKSDLGKGTIENQLKLSAILNSNF